jgi:hypothetical protein
MAGFVSSRRAAQRPKRAERNLKEKLTRRAGRVAGVGEITADSPFAKLVEWWLEDLDLEAVGVSPMGPWPLTCVPGRQWTSDSCQGPLCLVE